MTDIYGIPMDTILLITVVIMAVCLATVAAIALRNGIIFRMAIRNLPRRKGQTVLIMAGLMLSTLIIAASLTTGDTLSYSLSRSSYESLGQVDLTIGYTGDARGESEISTSSPTFPDSVAERLEEQLVDDPDIAGVMPVLTIDAPVESVGQGLSEPSAVVTGIDEARLDTFGGLSTPDGESIDFAGLPSDTIVVSESLARRLSVEAGDELRFYYDNQPQPYRVGAVAEDSFFTGYRPESAQAGPTQAGTVDLRGIAMPIDRLQAITGLDGEARLIAVTNAGGVDSGVERTDETAPRLREALSVIEGGERLGVNTIKQDAIAAAEQFGGVFLTFFMLFGTFSIAAGILLIFLIFMMLAAERRSEMGISRAIGMKRRHLIQGFIAEGAAYDLGAAMIGAAAGVVVAFGIVSALGSLLGDFVSITPRASWRSLVIAYSLGVSITFLTIVFASVRSSRLNIVAAIRDLPDESAPQRDRRPEWSWWSDHSSSGAGSARLLTFPVALVWNIVGFLPRLLIWTIRLLVYAVGWGPIITVPGIGITAIGVVLEQYFTFSLGLSLLVLGVALTLSRHLRPRAVYTAAAGFMLLYWLLPFDVTARVLPELGDGGPEMLFLSGIFMVTYLTLIIMWNVDLIVGVVSLSGRTLRRWLPAVKIGVAYPLSSRGRTGLTVAMFAIVIFSMVTVRTISANFSELIFSDEASAGWDVLVQTSPSNPVNDLGEQLAVSDIDTESIGAIGRVRTLTPESALVRNSGEDAWSRYPINAMDDQFVEHARIPLRARAGGYSSDAEVWEAISAGEPVAIVDSAALQQDDFGSEGGENRFLAPSSVDVAGGSFPEFDIELSGPGDEGTERVTVIGVIDTSASILSGFYLHESALGEVAESGATTQFYVQSSGSSEQAALGIERALDTRGVQAESIQAQLEEQQSFASGFFTLMLGFMGLGVFVGIAALGVISFRSVVERRQQIGMLRAIGYGRGMVAASFLLESLIVATLGVVSGVVLAVILSYNLVSGGELSEDFTTFVIPWTTILAFMLAAIVASLVMTWIPARTAASMPIAEALRYE